MSETSTANELDAAIADAELDEDEAARVRELVEEGAEPATAIALVYGDRGKSGDTPPPAPPAPAPPAAAFEVDDKKVEKEIGRHLTAMSTLLGPTAELYDPCDQCGGAGIKPAGPSMQTNELYRECPTCTGYGQVLTGARNDSWRTQPCPDCAGRGFQQKVAAAGDGNAAAAPVEDAGDGYGIPSWMGDPNLSNAAPAHS